MMETIVGLFVAAGTALGFFAYNHRGFYQNLAGGLLWLILAVFAGFNVWNFAVHQSASVVWRSTVFGTLTIAQRDQVYDAIRALGLSAWPYFVPLFVSAIYIVLLLFIPMNTEVEAPKPKKKRR